MMWEVDRVLMLPSCMLDFTTLGVTMRVRDISSKIVGWDEKDDYLTRV